MTGPALKEFERMFGLKIDTITGLFENEVASTFGRARRSPR